MSPLVIAPDPSVYATHSRNRPLLADASVQLLLLEYGDWLLVDSALPFLYFWSPSEPVDYDPEEALQIAIDHRGWITLVRRGGAFDGIYHSAWKLLIERTTPFQRVVELLRKHNVEIYLPLTTLEFLNVALRVHGTASA